MGSGSGASRTTLSTTPSKVQKQLSSEKGEIKRESTDILNILQKAEE
jgi:hypothetical protein